MKGAIQSSQIDKELRTGRPIIFENHDEVSPFNRKNVSWTAWSPQSRLHRVSPEPFHCIPILLWVVPRVRHMRASSKVHHLHREPCHPRVRGMLLDCSCRDYSVRRRVEVQPRCRLRRPRKQRGVVESGNLAREWSGAAEEDAEDECEEVHDGEDPARKELPEPPAQAGGKSAKTEDVCRMCGGGVEDDGAFGTGGQLDIALSENGGQVR